MTVTAGPTRQAQALSLVAAFTAKLDEMLTSFIDYIYPDQTEEKREPLKQQLLEKMKASVSDLPEAGCAPALLQSRLEERTRTYLRSFQRIITACQREAQAAQPRRRRDLIREGSNNQSAATLLSHDVLYGLGMRSRPGRSTTHLPGTPAKPYLPLAS